MASPIACRQDDYILVSRFTRRCLVAVCMLRYLPVPFWLRFEVSRLRLVVVRLYCYDGVAGRVIAELFNGNRIVEAEDDEE